MKDSFKEKERAMTRCFTSPLLIASLSRQGALWFSSLGFFCGGKVRLRPYQLAVLSSERLEFLLIDQWPTFVDALNEIRFHVLTPRKTLLFHFCGWAFAWVSVIIIQSMGSEMLENTLFPRLFFKKRLFRLWFPLLTYSTVWSAQKNLITMRVLNQ